MYSSHLYIGFRSLSCLLCVALALSKPLHILALQVFFAGTQPLPLYVRSLDTKVMFTVVESPWIRACRWLDLFPWETSPSPLPPWAQQCVCAWPYREQDFFFSQSASLLHTGFIQLLSKGLCWGSPSLSQWPCVHHAAEPGAMTALCSQSPTNRCLMSTE